MRAARYPLLSRSLALDNYQVGQLRAITMLESS